MKNKIAKIVTTLAVVIGIGFSGLATVEAGEDNYTYTYDYWGDVQESPHGEPLCGVHGRDRLHRPGKGRSLSIRIGSICVIPEITASLC